MKTKNVSYRNFLTGIFFVLWGMFWLALFILLGLRLMNETIFTALMGPVFAIASVLYVLSFYRYKKGVNENEN